MAQYEPVMREILTTCCLIWICPPSLTVKWSEVKVTQIVRQEQLWGHLGKCEACCPGEQSLLGTRAGARGLGSHLVLSYVLCILFAAESWTKYKKLVTGLAAGRMRNWMGWSAAEECLAHSSYFQNFPALAGVKLCGHHPPCQGDSALTREHRGEIPCVPVTEEGTMDVSSKDSLQASRLGPVQSRSVLASSEQWGKVTRQSLSPPFFLEGSVGTKCLVPQGENIWKDRERGRSPALYSWNWSLWMSSPLTSPAPYAPKTWKGSQPSFKSSFNCAAWCFCCVLWPWGSNLLPNQTQAQLSWEKKGS